MVANKGQLEVVKVGDHDSIAPSTDSMPRFRLQIT